MRVVHQGQGIYYGLARGRGGIYSVARNLNLQRTQLAPEHGTNRILLSRDSSFTDVTCLAELGPTADLHEVALLDDLLWLVSPTHPELRAYCGISGHLESSHSLADLVPSNLQHPPPNDRPADRYHFNSLHFHQVGEEIRLATLAHNWNFGAFALVLRAASSRALLAGDFDTEVITDLGYESHSLLWLHDGYYCLSSGESMLLHSREGALPLFDANQQVPLFPRGISHCGENHLLIGASGYAKQREARCQSESCLALVNLRDRCVDRIVSLGQFGDACDIEPLD